MHRVIDLVSRRRTRSTPATYAQPESRQVRRRHDSDEDDPRDIAAREGASRFAESGVNVLAQQSGDDTERDDEGRPE